MPDPTKDGPIPRTINLLGALPVMMNPPMMTLFPVSTLPRVERLSPEGGGTVGVGVGVAVAVAVPIGVEVAVAVGVAVGG